MMSESERRRLVSSFLEIAFGQTDETARQFLQATSWKLEEAILLFYAGNQSLHNAHNNDSSAAADEVRAPSPVVRDTLYGRSSSMYHLAPRSQSSSLIWGREQQGTSSTSASGSEVAVPPRDLASLYKPPFHLMFNGSFERAKSAASTENKWLLVNLQSTKEFSSHMLNRDTWGNDAVSQTIKNNFVFLQVDVDTPEGQKISTFYKVASVPVVLVIDPTTGQKIRLWCGMIDGEILLEDLVPFMDAGPQQQLASPMFKKHPRSSSVTALQPETRVDVMNEEEEELQRAVAASLDNMEIVRSSQKDQTCSSNVTPTLPPLPQEPTGDRSVLCRVGVRLPEGRRLMRNFLKTDPIQLLWSFCYSQLQESERKPFKLVETTIPGASRTIEYNSNVTFEQSGLANSMILLSWE